MVAWKAPPGVTASLPAACAVTGATALSGKRRAAARSHDAAVTGSRRGRASRRLRRQFEQSVAALAARDHVTNLFGQHVSPQVVERLMLEGTVLHADTATSKPTAQTCAHVRPSLI